MRDRGQSIPSQELGFEPEEKESVGKVYVEIGSGGLPAFFVSNRQINPGDRYFTVDMRDHEAEISKNFGEDLGVGFEAIQGDGSNLPFVENSVDEMIFNNVFGDPSTVGHDDMLLEALRVLKSGGQIVITEHITPGVFLKVFGQNKEQIDSYLQEHGIDLKVKKFSTDDVDVDSYVGDKKQRGIKNSGFQLILEKK